MYKQALWSQQVLRISLKALAHKHSKGTINGLGVYKIYRLLSACI